MNFSDTALLFAQELQLLASGGLVYEWSPPDDLSCVDCPDPLAFPKESRSYSVKIADPIGCREILVVEINLGEALKSLLEIPNTITPNGDGKNDRWVIKNLDLFPDHELAIFDRWGSEITRIRAYNNDWEGTNAEGKPLSAGVYFFILDLANGEQCGGEIMVLR